MAENRKINANAIRQAFLAFVRSPGFDGSDEPEPPDGLPRLTFFRVDLGGVSLYRDSAKRYKESLSAIRKGLPEDSGWSVREVEKLFQEAILRVLDIRETESEKDSAGRKQVQAERLVAALGRSPRAFDVRLLVTGFDEKSLPRLVGRVTFSSSTKLEIETMLRAANRESFVDQNGLPRLPPEFQLARVGVLANDYEAAQDRGTRIVATTSEILNFFSDVFHPRGWGARIRIAAEDPTVTSQALILDSSGGTHANLDQRAPLAPFNLPPFDSDKSRKSMLPVANRILAKQPPSEHELRLVAAMRWAGQATVEPRREKAFLFYAIALESLVVAKKQPSGLVNEVATRTAWLISDNPAGRIKVARRIRELYDLRSKIAHAGVMEITDSDLSDMRWLAKDAIYVMLEGDGIPALATSKDFEQWISARTLGAGPGDAESKRS